MVSTALKHQPLLTETEVLPWDVQVKAQAVPLAGKLRQGQTNAPKNKLAGELGKALAAAKQRAKGEQMKNGFLIDALPFARQWGVQLEQPRGRMAKGEWKAAIRAGVRHRCPQREFTTGLCVRLTRKRRV